MKGRMKSSGVKQNAPRTPLMSPKKGRAAETKVAKATYEDRSRKRGTKLRIEYLPSFTSEVWPSKISNVGCEYTSTHHFIHITLSTPSHGNYRQYTNEKMRVLDPC